MVYAFVKTLRSWLLMVLTLALVPQVSAEFIVSVAPTTQLVDSGLTRYSYTINNEASSTQAFIQFQIVVAPGAAPQMLTGPMDWHILFDNKFDIITWTSQQPSTDILPGGTGTFSFVSPFGPGTQEYAAFGFDEVTRDGNVVFGETISPTFSPAAVPEPAALTSGLIGVVLAGAGFWWHRRRASA